MFAQEINKCYTSQMIFNKRFNNLRNLTVLWLITPQKRTFKAAILMFGVLLGTVVLAFGFAGFILLEVKVGPSLRGIQIIATFLLGLYALFFFWLKNQETTNV
jgi:hypothetical protein